LPASNDKHRLRQLPGTALRRHSFAIDLSGRIIAMADTSPGPLLATFDLGAIRKARREERFCWQI
jgi:predicted amidohydrolase